MIVKIEKLLSPRVLEVVQRELDAAPWESGSKTAGDQAVRVKNNQQLDERSQLAQQLGDVVMDALAQSNLFISSALPQRIYPPLFNRCHVGEGYGLHVDNALRVIPGTAMRLRTDLSATLFLSDPDTYEGGALQIQDKYGTQEIKLAAGDMVLYSSTSLHQVLPVTSGVRTCAVFWLQSMVRSDAQREVLFDVDTSLQSLTQQLPAGDENLIRLNRTYQNLLQQWADT